MLTDDQPFAILQLFQWGTLILKRLIVMKTFLFELKFTCPYQEVTTIKDKEYRSQDKQTAIKGIQSYCNTNKNMLDCTFKFIKQL